MEDEENGLVLLRADLLLDVGLVLLEELRVEADVTGLVDAVDVSETGGDGEVGADGSKTVVDVEDVLWLGVEGVVVDGLVVDTVLLTTSDTDFLTAKLVHGVRMHETRRTYHLEPLLHRSDALEVLGGGFDVPLNLLLGQVNHVRREEGFSMELEVSLILVEHAIQPGKKLLRAVVGVKNDGDAILRGDRSDVVGTGDGTSDGGFLVRVGNTLIQVSNELI